jgi:predicted CopG family antitoxin
MAATTTIVIRQETKERLDELKRHPRESYNDVVDRLARMATEEEIEAELELR